MSGFDFTRSPLFGWVGSVRAEQFDLGPLSLLEALDVFQRYKGGPGLVISCCDFNERQHVVDCDCT